MKPYPEHFRSIPVHFILCTERTGSSMLTTMLNASDEILSTSEELFALYFYPKYKHKVQWSEEDVDHFIYELTLMHEDHIQMYFSDVSVLKQSMLEQKQNLPYQDLVRLIYLHFIDLKDKTRVKVIVDKQIKFLYHLKEVNRIFPDSKFIVLHRDVRDNVVSRRNKKMNDSDSYIYLAGIWNDTYSKVEELIRRYGRQVLPVKYEELVKEPVKELQKICAFLNVTYDPAMLNFHENFSAYLTAKKEVVGEDYYQSVIHLHDAMLKPLDANKIGYWKTHMDKATAAKIAGICYKTGQSLGYDLAEPFGVTPLSIYDKLNVWYARLMRYHYIRFYLALPLWVKLAIKKLRGKPKRP